MRTWLHRIERALLLVALLSFGLYGAGWATGALSEVSGTRELAELSEVRPPAAAAGATRVRPRPQRASAVARIVIPRLQLSAIVREGVDARTLRRAVGHVPATALPGEPGNVGLAGHRDTFFRSLEHVRVGDVILIEAPDQTLRYIVRSTRIVSPTETSVLDPTPHPTLTLVTCYPFDFVGPAPQRFIVRAEAGVEG